MYIGCAHRDPLDSLQVSIDNQSDLLCLELRCFILISYIWGVTLLIIKTGMKHANEACVVLYSAQGLCNTGMLDLVCLHYITTLIEFVYIVTSFPLFISTMKDF